MLALGQTRIMDAAGPKSTTGVGLVGLVGWGMSAKGTSAGTSDVVRELGAGGWDVMCRKTAQTLVVVGANPSHLGGSSHPIFHHTCRC